MDQSLENKMNSDLPVDDVLTLEHAQQFEEYSRPDENEGINDLSVIAAGINPKESNGDSTEDVVQLKHIRELHMEKLEELVLQDQKDDTMNRPKGKKNDLMGEDYEEGGHLQKVSHYLFLVLRKKISLHIVKVHGIFNLLLISMMFWK